MGSELEMRPSSQSQAQRLNELHDEEESALLNDAGRASPAGGPSRPSPSLSRDFAVCSAAWSRLSRPTRCALVFLASALLVLAVYELGVDEGVREQGRDNAEQQSTTRPWKSWRVFGGGGGGDDVEGANANAKSGEGGGVVQRERDQPPEEAEGEGGKLNRRFGRDVLLNTRARAKELIYTLHEYYGGEEKARAILANSWQAQWMLDDEFVYLGENEEQGDDDDDNDEGDDTDDEKRRRMKRNRDGKRNKNKHENEGNNDSETRNKERKNKKKKGVKEGKIVDDPDKMSGNELKAHHHRRRQRTSKLVSTMARAVLNPHQDRFVIGTIGSSVAAGHDNCHYDSYESQLERTLSPVFAGANMFAIVQNAGEGGSCGDNHQNQVFCITHNVSPDVDVVHYSWTYFEKNRPEVQREQLIRWAQRMGRRPMVHHLVARGKKNTCEGHNTANAALDRAYAAYGYNAFCIQTGLYFGGHDYDADLEAGINRFGWKHQGDGYHNTTRYGEELPEGNARRDSLGVVYRNWHPGPLGFQLASDAFAYVYVTGLLMALDVIERDMDAGADPLDRWFPAHDSRALWTNSSLHRRLHGALLPLNMPAPLFCDSLYCSTPHPPSCLNYERPTFGAPGIEVRDQAGWEVYHSPNKWNFMVGKVDIAIIKGMHDKEWEQRCAHLDACGGVHASDATQGALTFALPSSRMTAGLVFLCFCCGKQPGGGTIAEHMFLDNPNVTVSLNGRALVKEGMDSFPNNKCVRVLRRFGEGGYEREDEMLLTLEMAEQDPDLAYELKPHVEVSHVVAL